uniref:Uncharacterized protein n=1 Tax=Glossina palpalis gambiensis TaxID=67801 RepID=A0A1B0BWI6_9MUSC
MKKTPISYPMISNGIAENGDLSSGQDRINIGAVMQRNALWWWAMPFLSISPTTHANNPLKHPQPNDTRECTDSCLAVIMYIRISLACVPGFYVN